MPNALAEETSPYLLQHKDNPVNWVPWSDKAFERAREEDKLVFLSVGYSTCHWCHVMEHESFENEVIAALMNEHFVCVKVDREERPDIDGTYMAFVQSTTGQGGWPMSVWLTPGGEPLVGGTYFPPVDRGGRAGFPRICAEIGKLWRNDREKMAQSAARLMDKMRQTTAHDAVVQGLPAEKLFGDFIDQCEAMFDYEWGGWGAAPKFPRPVVPRLLLQLADRYGLKSDEGEACLQMVERTLKTMSAGGIHDHLAGGFHRYSVDRYWHVPHYEKMLYDQGQLALLYLEAWQATSCDEYRSVAENIFDYVISDMQDSAGAFHAAEDADSLDHDGAIKEGAYWTWTAEEIYQLLDAESAAIFCSAFGVEQDGNARPESDPHVDLKGRNTLYRAMSCEALIETFGEEAATKLRHAKSVLKKQRSCRPLPHRDDKVITAWNGLMISALARGSRLLDRNDLKDAAESAAKFIESHLIDENGLLRSWRGKQGKARAFPADYIYFISALIELHGISEKGHWLDLAIRLQDELDSRYWESSRASYVMRCELAGESLFEFTEDYDGAEPAPSHTAAYHLQALAALTGNNDYRSRAESILRAGARRMDRQSFACPVLIGAYDIWLRGITKMEVRGQLDEKLAAKARASYIPRAVWSVSSGPGEIIACEGELCRSWPESNN